MNQHGGAWRVMCVEVLHLFPGTLPPHLLKGCFWVIVFFFFFSKFRLYSFIISWQPSKWTFSLSLAGCSRKLIQPEEGVLGTVNLQSVGKKHRYQLVTAFSGRMVGGSLCGTEPLTCGIGHYPGNVGIDLNSRTHSWCPRIVWVFRLSGVRSKVVL